MALRAGDPMLPTHTMLTENHPFANRLGQGRRAITMPVDVINSVSGLLEPGDLIDLYVSFEYRRKRITAPLLQGVMVLATGGSTRPVGNRPSGGAATYSTITIDPTPEDSLKLVADTQSGHLHALLLHPSAT